MTDSSEPFAFSEPIPSTREDWETYNNKESSVTCRKFTDGNGGWGCTGQCTITSDYQEACVPKVYHNPSDPDSPIYWCECVPTKEIPDLIRRGEKIKAEWTEVPDFNFIPREE